MSKKKKPEKLIDGEFDPKEWAKAQKSELPEIRALKQDNALLRRKLESHETGVSLIIQAVKESYIDPPDLVIPPAPRFKRKRSEEIAIMHLSDTQLGKRTATYGSAIGQIRIMNFAKKVVDITNMRRNSAMINELRIYMGGDMIEGEDIFPGQAHEIDQVLFDQAVKTAPSIFVKMILYLLQHFEKITVCCVPGNHGRNGRKGNNGSKRTNWDKVVYEITSFILLGNDDSPRPDLRGRLSFDIAEDWYVVDRVFDWGNLQLHGDQIRGGFAGFPWYGTAKKAWGWIDSIDEPWDYLWFGHFHTYASAVLNHRIFLANGTTESSNVYAQEQLAASGFPCQRLSFFNAKHGLISDNQVFLTDDKERLPQRLRPTQWK
jgi:hypothetical protein